MIYEGQKESRIFYKERAFRSYFMVYPFATILLFLLHVLHGAALSEDGVSLLAFKRSVEVDPCAVFSNWNENDTDPCSWTGVICNFKTLRVVSLNITGSKSCNLDCGEGEQSRNDDVLLGNVSSCFSNSSHRVSAPSSFFQGYNQTVCRLRGAIPPEIGNLVELQVLAFPWNGLFGQIPDELGNLSSLQILDLRSNCLSGRVPSSLGKLSLLAILNLESNFLSGEVPEELFRCKSLFILNLAKNNLVGKISGFLHSLFNLQHLYLSFNNFEGPVLLEPNHSCSTLESLHLAGNFLTGSIPSALGNCSQLRALVLNDNLFSGSIPSELGRLFMLQLLDVSKNNLSGSIPAEIGNCTHLSVLILTNIRQCLSGLKCSFVDKFQHSNLDKPESNSFEGSLPSSIAVLPEISIIWAPKAGLTGVLPDDWGMCQILSSLNLAENEISGKFPSGLASCRSLIILDLSSNQLQGSIPPELPISCMVLFNVSRNKLSGFFSPRAPSNCSNYSSSPSAVLVGEISSPYIFPFELLLPPYEFCGLWRGNSIWNLSAQEFIIHDLSENSLTGFIPGPLIGNSLIQMKPRYALFLAGNQFTGDMSSSLFSLCEKLQAFAISLGRNYLSGELPAKSIEHCSSLIHLEAANNYITGNLPYDVSNLRYLSHVDLASNKLNGTIPQKWGQLLELQYLSLQNNSFTGIIPAEFGKLFLLQALDLSKNHLTGGIPNELGKLKQLKRLILNNNYFSGRIPESFCNLSALNFVDMAFNNLSGPIPRLGTFRSLCTTMNFRGNPYLEDCHEATPLMTSQSPTPPETEFSSNGLAGGKKPKLNSVLIAAITAGCAILVVLFILGLLFQYTRQQESRRPNYRSCRKEVVTFTTLNFHLTYESVVRATGNFSVDNLIGNGGFGATYKAELMPGLVVAVKRLAIGRFQGVQQFDAEIRTLGRIRHPNLVTLVGSYASEAEMFLIYNYFPRGNLEGFIHNRQRGEISWQVVHKIALRIAQALAFLHDDCFPRVLHRDIKPSNILLDNNLNAYLSDFGLARLLGASETHATTDVAGTFGYVAPEYAMTCRVSDKADVYSYGVVLLELLSGKRALDPCFSDFGDGFNIVGWVCLLIGEGRTHEIFIVELWELEPESQLLEALKLAVMCTVDSLVIRPSMRQVVERLRSIQPSMPFS